MSVPGQNRRYEIRLANDRFLIHKRTLRATASSDPTWQKVGHPAIVARTGVAILASPDAGPLGARYWANLTAATLTITIAVAAAPIASLLGILPKSYIFALAGLAILSSLQDAFVKAFSEKLCFGALVAFAVAATPFAFAGITSAFWGVVAGLVASLLAERRQLLTHWREQ